MPDIRVHFLSAFSYKAHCLTYPLRAFGRALQERGIQLKFYYSLADNLADCDVLILSTEAFGKRRLKLVSQERNAVLESLRSKADTMIWFDMTDGTGTTSFGVLPFVDLYCKTALLKDRRDYTRAHYNTRVFSDYYHTAFGIADPNPVSDREVLAEEHMDKLFVSWNLGLGDMHPNTAFRRRLRTLVPRANYRFRSQKSDSQRNYPASYRVSMHGRSPTVAYQRVLVEGKLKALAAERGLAMPIGGKIPYGEYMDELFNSKISPSPFGWGEICFRDFETFLSGALLLKADMEHLETWPEYYVPGTTYIPFRWDLSDFEEQFTSSLDNDRKRVRIAQHAQDLYLSTIGEQGGQKFAQRFFDMLSAAAVRSDRAN